MANVWTQESQNNNNVLFGLGATCNNCKLKFAVLQPRRNNVAPPDWEFQSNSLITCYLLLSLTLGEKHNSHLAAKLIISVNIFVNQEELIMAVERRLTISYYQDHELFGPGPETIKLIEKIKTANDSECIIFSRGTFASLEHLKLKNLIGTDRRLNLMVEGLGITHALPIQRYSWPKIQKSSFATFYVSGEATGKTYAILLYVLTNCLNAAPITEAEEVLNEETKRHVVSENYTDPNELISHPKYVLICSNQDKADLVYQAVDHFKDKVYGDSVPNTKRHSLTPITAAIKSDHDNDKLSSRCLGSDILITSPQVLIKCLNEGFVHFAKFRKVFFDDLDVALQVQPNCIKNLIKIYFIQMEKRSDLLPSTMCRMHMFSRKWTALVNQVAELFDQRTVMFCSISEAAVYAGIRFEVISYKKKKRDQTSVIGDLIDVSANQLTRGEKTAIVCNTGKEAELIGVKLQQKGIKVKLIKDIDEMNPQPANELIRGTREKFFVLSDSALEIVVESTVRGGPLNDISHLVHASLPDDMLTFDQRFRLLHENIKNKRPSNMTSTLILDADSNIRLLKHIYDLASRSQETLNSTRCELRDLISKQASQICWRWATTGVCRYEKLSQNDRFGSYCLDRHPARADLAVRDANWPESGLVKITITHIISPSEFYFMFEACKMDDKRLWVNYKSSGTEFSKRLQQDLDALRTTKTRSIPLNKIVKGKVYAVFFPQISRVDRVRILDEPKHEDSSSMINPDLEYDKLIPVYKIDHGVSLNVYVKNLVELPRNLAIIPALCHRAFHLGYKPPDNEPDWLYKSKKHFFDLLSVNQKQDVTAWIRLNHRGCFWLEGLLITRELENIDAKSKKKWTIDPYDDLRQLNLAQSTSLEPSILPPSTRLETLCRWNHAEMISASQYAFLRKDKDDSDIYVLRINSDLSMIVRQACYNKQLIALEDQLIEDFQKGKLKRQEYLAPEVICIANLNPLHSPQLCLNRVKILSIESIENCNLDSTECTPEVSALVYCLDHGDKFSLKRSSLYQARLEHIRQLPFQAIECELANLNKELIDSSASEQRNNLIDIIYNLTRDDMDNYKKVICRRCEDGRVHLFVSTEDPIRYDPLYMLLEDKTQAKLLDKVDRICSQPVVKSDLQIDHSDRRSIIVMVAMRQLLLDMAKESLFEAETATSDHYDQ